MINNKIVCKLRNSSTDDLVAELVIPRYVFILPIHTADAFGNANSNKEQIITTIKTLLNTQIEELEIEELK